jgi:beta-galactosidase
MILGVQYYRPPFPEQRFWADDFKRIKETGLNAVQLWVLWAWVEPKPDAFEFGDFDRLVELAGQHDLGVVISTIGEIQPYWIHRVVPGSEMIDHMGHAVISSNRGECHFGLTPGGCTDHPGVWERMRNFLTVTAARYKDVPQVRGWDAWNETRWNVYADGLVCHCPHTLAAFHGWLDRRYGGLDGLNKAWRRRYGHWDEVLPGKVPPRPYTEMMAFQHFLTWRADQLGIARWQTVKEIITDKPVTVHGATPCARYSGHFPGGPDGGWDQALNRGNDWFMADVMDGVGCSSFPSWGNGDDFEFEANVQYVRSAARGKQIWFSEVQGGRAIQRSHVTPEVDSWSQQRWLWRAVAGKADSLIFWCWRDEVFGKESGGYGILGYDEFSPARMEALAFSGPLIEREAALLQSFTPDAPRAGILFSPQSYYVDWAQEGNAQRSAGALHGYARALMKESVPFRLIEEEHLDELAQVKILFMPSVTATTPAFEQRVATWVRAGGTLVCEAECGAFDPVGIYRYPNERFLAALLGIHEVGRRQWPQKTFTAALGRAKYKLNGALWCTPYTMGAGAVWAKNKYGALITRVPVGKGAVIAGGAFLGEAYHQKPYRDFERFVAALATAAGVTAPGAVTTPAITATRATHVIAGVAGGKRMVYVFLPPGATRATVRFPAGFFTRPALREVLTGARVAVARGPAGCQLARLGQLRWGMAVLVEG